MLDIREAQIEGDEEAVTLLKRHYGEVRVGDLDTSFYGKGALTFQLRVPPCGDAFYLFPSQDVHRVWERLERGFKPAEASTFSVGKETINCSYLMRPSVPMLVVFLSPMEQEMVDNSIRPAKAY
jgi:hypothetical protein